MEKINKKVYFIMDNSGSMETTKKEMAEKIYNEYCKKYSCVEIITHTTVAKFATTHAFSKGESGGTYMSSGLALALSDVIANNYNDCIFVQVGDGGNWSEDNERLYNLINYIKNNNSYHYYELLPSTYHETMYTKISSEIGQHKNITMNKFDNARDFDIHYGLCKKDYIIYEVEHKVDGKLYDFKSTNRLRAGAMVVCNTVKGLTYGRVKNIKVVTITNEEYLSYSDCWHIK